MNKKRIASTTTLIRKLNQRAKELRQMGLEESSRWNNSMAGNYYGQAASMIEVARALK